MRTNANVVSITRFWQAANYLAAGMLYLKRNPLLKNQITSSDFKDHIVGHWGASPGVNAIYAHTSDLIRRKEVPMRLIVGTGHAGAAVLANLYLEGTLYEYNSQYSLDQEGMSHLCSDYGTKNGWDNEIAPEYPGMIYMGGELGGALAFAQGCAFNKKSEINVCILGDGELETAVTQGSWQGFKFLLPDQDGKVLPIINANGYRMGSGSLFAEASRRQKIQFFKGHNIQPIFAGTDHKQIACAFDDAYEMLKGFGQPVIILETPKGWTAPEIFGQKRFAGTADSHKPVLKLPAQNRVEMEMVVAWLKSYHPDQLFDEQGAPQVGIRDCLPLPALRLGNSHTRAQENHPASITRENSGITNFPESAPIIQGVEDALVETMGRDKDFILFSPDEAQSNQMGNIIVRRGMRKTTSSCPKTQEPSTGQVVEVLNEQLCHAWAHGYGSQGNHSVIVSYEAFAPLFDSMSAQYIKFIDRSRLLQWRPEVASLNIVLTSLGWRNVGTHHNPGYVDALLGRGLESVNIYMPTSPHIAKSQIHSMVQRFNSLNVMVLSKHDLPKLQAENTAFSKADQRLDTGIWRQLGIPQERAADISLIAIGDCMAEECLGAKELLAKTLPGLNVCVNTVEEPSALDRKIRDIAPAMKGSLSSVWAYLGYPKTIEALLWRSGLSQAHIGVVGYKDKSRSNAGIDRYVENGASRYDIAISAVTPIHSRGELDCSELINFCQESINSFNL